MDWNTYCAAVYAARVEWEKEQMNLPCHCQASETDHVCRDSKNVEVIIRNARPACYHRNGDYLIVTNTNQPLPLRE